MEPQYHLGNDFSSTECVKGQVGYHISIDSFLCILCASPNDTYFGPYMLMTSTFSSLFPEIAILVRFVVFESCIHQWELLELAGKNAYIVSYSKTWWTLVQYIRYCWTRMCGLHTQTFVITMFYSVALWVGSNHSTSEGSPKMVFMAAVDIEDKAHVMPGNALDLLISSHKSGCVYVILW